MDVNGDLMRFKVSQWRYPPPTAMEPENPVHLFRFSQLGRILYGSGAFGNEIAWMIQPHYPIFCRGVSGCVLESSRPTLK